jgi:hypothetical protein
MKNNKEYRPEGAIGALPGLLQDGGTEMFDYKDAKRRAVRAREQYNKAEINVYELKHQIAIILEQVEDAFLLGQHFKNVNIKTKDNGIVSAIWIDEEPPQKGKTVDIQSVEGRGNIAYNTEMFML